MLALTTFLIIFVSAQNYMEQNGLMYKILGCAPLSFGEGKVFDDPRKVNELSHLSIYSSCGYIGIWQ